MENTSKAILIVSGVLISLLIIGTLFLIFSKISDSKIQMNNAKIAEQLGKLNNEIELFTSSSKIYGTNILSLCNLIENYQNLYPVSNGYSEIQMNVNFKNALFGWNEMSGTLSYEQILSLYTEKEEYVKSLGAEQIKNVNNSKIIGTIESLSELRDNEIDWYIEKSGLTGSYAQIIKEEILNKTEKYREEKMLLTEFKNKKFKCIDITYSQDNRIVNSLKFEIK